MEETQKPFACTFEGCDVRFTNEDHLTVHKKKHDMVLNFGNGHKTNVFVADQTPTPTRFIRNCEEVGLFQDLQNVNPFEETFRKAVEASRVGGSHLEVGPLHVPAAIDDTLHTPHVFPNITEEHGSITNLISSTSVTVETQPGGKSPSREGLVSLHVPNILHPVTSVAEVSDGATADLDADIAITALGSSGVHVVKQEADTSQQIPSRASSTDSGCKLPVATASAQDTVQVVFRMPDGRLVQLSGVSMDSIPSTQLPVQVTPAVVPPAPVSQSVAAPNTVIINTQFVQTATQMTKVTTGLQRPVAAAAAAAASEAAVPAPCLSNGETGGTLQARLTVAKMKLKQRIQYNCKRKQSVTSEVQSDQVSPKKGPVLRTLRVPSSEGSDASVSAAPKGRRMSSTGSDADEQKRRFRERNRAAAMRCREKRKNWILELEKRADETQRTNQQLTAEVAKLRSELMHLKTLLLAHKDCPVTKAMQQNAGITIARAPGAGKASPVAQVQAQQSTATVSSIPVTISNAVNVNVCAPLTDPHPKLVLLSKPAGLKRRRQQAAALGGTSQLKTSQVHQTNSDCVLSISQPISGTSAVSDTTQVSSSCLQDEVLKASIIPENTGAATPQTCVITVAGPLLSAGVPSHQGIAIKSAMLAPTSYLVPTKFCLPSTDSTLPQVIKLNPSILKSELCEEIKASISHASGDSMDSGHGSDIEILAELPVKAEGKS